MTKPIFLTLQRGQSLLCWRLGLPHAAFSLSLLLLGAIWFWPEPPADPKTLSETKWRIAALQSELEKSVSQQAVTAQLLNTRLAEAQHRIAQLEGQEQALAALDSFRGPEHKIHEIDNRITRIERKQVQRLRNVTQARADEIRQIEGALKLAGIQIADDTPKKMTSAQGGPFVPLSEAFHTPFGAELAKAEPLLARHTFLRANLTSLPLRAPLSGVMEVTSNFGARMDPFHGRAAWHTGIDMRQEVGADVLSAASGTVTAAGWNGAYGLMVDIDHGNGLLTRYAHLSRVLVREGDVIRAQAPLGRSGASGRTTGAHLHYELRINGEPVDPARFLKAGQNIALLLKDASRTSEPAQ